MAFSWVERARAITIRGADTSTPTTRGHTYMTSALRGREGGCPKHDDSTDRLREWDSDKGWVQKSENFAYVI